jgi:hypothetical protein
MIKNLLISILLIAGLTGGFIALNTGCGGAPADGVLAVISESSGTFTINAKPAKTGDELKAGDTVETGPDSYAVIKYKQDNYELMLFSSKTSQQNASCQIKPIKSESKTFVINLINGILTFFVPPADQRSSSLEITADDAVVSIRQTKGKVENDPSKLNVALVNGKVNVNYKGQDTAVEAGYQLFYDKIGAKKIEVKPYDFYDKAEQEFYYKGKVDNNPIINDK